MILRDSLAFCGWLLLTAQYVGAAEGNGKERFQVLAHAGHRAAVTAVALVEKEGLVITGSADRSVIIWNAQSGEMHRKIGVRDRVLGIHSEEGMRKLWVVSGERAGPWPPQCFDRLTGEELDVEVHHSGAMGVKPADALPAAARQAWQRLEPRLGRKVSDYFLTADGAYALLDFAGLGDEGSRGEFWDANAPRKLQDWKTGDLYMGRKRRLSDASDPREQALWRTLKPAVSDETTAACLTSDGGHAVLGYEDGRAELWDSKTPRLMQRFETKAAAMHGVACSGDGTRLATWSFLFGRAQTGASPKPDLRFWDLTTMQVRRCELPKARGLISACLTKDGKLLYAVVATSAMNWQLLEIDAVACSVIRQVAALPRPASLRLSPDESHLVVNEYWRENSARVLVWDRRQAPAAMKEIPWSAEGRSSSRAAFFPDNSQLLIGYWERPSAHDLPSGRKRFSLTEEAIEVPSGGRNPLRKMAPPPDENEGQGMVGQIVDLDVRADGRWIAYGTTHRGIGGHEVVDLQNRAQWAGNVAGLHHIRFRPGFPHVIASGSHFTKTVQVRQLETGAVISEWSESQGEADRGAHTGATGWTSLMDSLALTADGKRLFLVKTDGTIRMLEISPEGKLSSRLELVPVGGADWCAVMANGHYAGSPGGVAAVRLTRESAGLPLAQLDWKYNRPDLIAAAAGAPAGAVATLRKLVEARAEKADSGGGIDPFASEAQPKVRLLSSSSLPILCEEDTFRVKVEAVPAAAPLARLQVLVNGVAWPGPRGIPIAESGARKPAVVRELEVPLSDGINRIHISAVDAAGAESLRQTLQVERLRPRRRGVRLLAVGVSAYADSQWNLEFASSDARAIKELVSGWADPGCEVRARVLTDAEATRDAIRAAAAEVFRETSADDLAVVFLAGHGVLDPSQRQTWYFCPHDHDFSAHGARGLRFDDLKALLDGVAARQRLLLIDSCHAGELDAVQLASIQHLAGARGVRAFTAGPAAAATRPPSATAGSQTLALQDLFADFRAGVGMAVIGASGALQFAMESTRLRHGVFTHALLEGFSKKSADLDQDGRVLASELHRHLADEVLSATGGHQRPSSRGIHPEADFVVAHLEAARPDPVEFLRRYLQSSSSWSDNFQAVERMLDENVEYFGARRSRAQVMDEARQYSQRWSHRTYELLDAQCEKAPDGAAATLRYRMEFEARGADSQEKNGVQTLEMKLAWRAGGWRITSIRLLSKEPAKFEADGGDPAAFVKQFIAAGSTGGGDQLRFYDQQLSRYFDERSVTLAHVRKDLEAYQSRWPFRRYTLAGEPKIQPAGDGAWKVSLSLEFHVSQSADGSNLRSGKARNTLLVARKGAGFVVRAIWAE